MPLFHQASIASTSLTPVIEEVYKATESIASVKKAVRMNSLQEEPKLAEEKNEYDKKDSTNA